MLGSQSGANSGGHRQWGRCPHFFWRRPSSTAGVAALIALHERPFGDCRTQGGRGSPNPRCSPPPWAGRRAARRAAASFRRRSHSAAVAAALRSALRLQPALMRAGGQRGGLHGSFRRPPHSGGRGSPMMRAAAPTAPRRALGAATASPRGYAADLGGSASSAEGCTVPLRRPPSAAVGQPTDPRGSAADPGRVGGIAARITGCARRHATTRRRQ